METVIERKISDLDKGIIKKHLGLHDPNAKIGDDTISYCGKRLKKAGTIINPEEALNFVTCEECVLKHKSRFGV